MTSSTSPPNLRGFARSDSLATFLEYLNTKSKRYSLKCLFSFDEKRGCGYPLKNYALVHREIFNNARRIVLNKDVDHFGTKDFIRVMRTFFCSDHCIMKGKKTSETYKTRFEELWKEADEDLRELIWRALRADLKFREVAATPVKPRPTPAHTQSAPAKVRSTRSKSSVTRPSESSLLSPHTPDRPRTAQAIVGEDIAGPSRARTPSPSSLASRSFNSASRSPDRERQSSKSPSVLSHSSFGDGPIFDQSASQWSLSPRSTSGTSTALPFTLQAGKRARSGPNSPAASGSRPQDNSQQHQDPDRPNSTPFASLGYARQHRNDASRGFSFNTPQTPLGQPDNQMAKTRPVPAIAIEREITTATRHRISIPASKIVQGQAVKAGNVRHPDLDVRNATCVSDDEETQSDEYYSAEDNGLSNSGTERLSGIDLGTTPSTPSDTPVEPLRDTLTFEPYTLSTRLKAGSRSSEHLPDTIAAAMRKLILEQIKQPTGHIYIFEAPEFFDNFQPARLKEEHWVKIGVSDDVQQRMSDIERKCGMQGIRQFHVDGTGNMRMDYLRRIEKLCHVELKNYQRFLLCGKDNLGVKCTTKHTEWFAVDKEKARETVQRWIRFFDQEPYGFDGKLGDFWDRRLQRKHWNFGGEMSEDKFAEKLDEWIQSCSYEPC